MPSLLCSDRSGLVHIMTGGLLHNFGAFSPKPLNVDNLYQMFLCCDTSPMIKSLYLDDFQHT